MELRTIEIVTDVFLWTLLALAAGIAAMACFASEMRDGRKE